MRVFLVQNLRKTCDLFEQQLQKKKKSKLFTMQNKLSYIVSEGNTWSLNTCFIYHKRLFSCKFSERIVNLLYVKTWTISRKNTLKWIIKKRSRRRILKWDFNNVRIYSHIQDDSEQVFNNLQKGRAHYG